MTIPQEMGEGPRGPEEANVSLLDLVAIVLRHWRTILGAMLTAVLLTGALLVLQPKTYQARTVLVPVPDPGMSRTQALAAQLPAGLPKLTAGTSSNEELIEVILESRSLMDTIVSRTLGKPLDSQPEAERAIRAVLAKKTKVKNDAEGSITVEVEASTPRDAALIAGQFPGAINDIAARVRSEAALRRQAFLERQLLTAREKLVATEEQLQDFQQRRGTVDLGEQAKRTVETAAQYQQAIVEQELEVARIRRTATPDNPLLRSAVAELAARREQLRRLTAGGAGNPAFLPLNQSSELKVSSTRLLREFAKDEQIYLSLTAALAESQIDVNNRLPVLAVLDPADTPRGPYRANVKLVLLAAAAVGLLFGLVAAFVRDHIEQASRADRTGRFFVAWEHFKHDLGRLVPGRRRRAQPGTASR
jgi:uncharacterized protein involved in exopolysaccharide biosynthesis